MDAILQIVALVLEKEKGVFVEEILIDEIATRLMELRKKETHMVHERFICPVGQGGFSIEMIDGFVVVYDCGSVSSPNAVELSIDKLWQDADHVDVLFISHFDKDHVNSIRYLLSHIKVLKAVTSFIPSVLRTAYGVYTDGAYTAITQLLKDNGVDTEEIGDGEVNKRPYYFRNIWEWIAKSMMTPADFSAVTVNLQQSGVVLETLNIDPDYLERQKEKINEAFKDVFGPKGPNSKGLIVLSQKCRGIETKLCLIYQGCEWCRNVLSRIANNVSSCLYVGDADLKNRANKKDVKEFLNNNRSESPLLMMQIPHHGSQYNVGARFETDFAAKYYFVNDITTKRIQGNQRLYNSLMSQKKLLVVNENCKNLVVTITEIK